MSAVATRSFRSLLFFFAVLSLFGCWLIGAPEAVIVCISVVSMVIGFSLGGVNRLHHRPHDMFARRIPSYMMLWRCEPNVAYWGEVYGDWRLLPRTKSVRDRRVVKFVTDSAGFRNKMLLSEKIDVVVLIGPGAVVLLAIFGGNDLDETYLRTNDFAAIAPQELYAFC